MALPSDFDFNSRKTPPLGCPPEIVYKEQRVKELALAIQRHCVGGYFSPIVAVWCDELSRRLKEMN